MMHNSARRKLRISIAGILLLLWLIVVILWLEGQRLHNAEDYIYANLKPGMPRTEFYAELHQRGYVTEDTFEMPCRPDEKLGAEKNGIYHLVQIRSRYFPAIFVADDYDLCTDASGKIGWLALVDY